MTELVPAPAGELARASPVETFARQAWPLIAAAYASPNTRAAYSKDLRRWLAFCREHLVNPYLAQAEHAAIFREVSLRALQSSSVYRLLASLSTIYRLLARENPKLGNPFDRATTGRPSASAVKPHEAVPEDAAAKMMAACQADPDRELGARDAAVLALLWSTGVRRAFVAAARTEGWAMDPSGEGLLRSRWKGGDMVDVRVPAEAAALIQGWLQVRRAPSEQLFATALGPLTGSGVYQMVKRRAAAAGVDPKRVSPHGFRAGFATRAWSDPSLKDADIQAAMHHASMETTRGYNRGEFGARVSRAIGSLPQMDQIARSKT